MVTTNDRALATPAPIAFTPGVSEKIGYYVYLLIDPRDGAVFYVGKGTGNRCFAHLAEARETAADAIGDYAKLARIREIESLGGAVLIDILRHGLSEHEAYLVESSAIDLLGMPDLTNRVAGHDAFERGRMSVLDINVGYGATPVDIEQHHRVVLIRINRNFERGITDEALYEATRKWWKVAHAKRQLDSLSAPEWAMAIYGGIVRAVYRIERWERPSEDDLAEHPTLAPRWSFHGTRDRNMEALYVHRDVSKYLRAVATGNPTQNPIRYVNCEDD